MFSCKAFRASITVYKYFSDINEKYQDFEKSAIAIVSLEYNLPFSEVSKYFCTYKGVRHLSEASKSEEDEIRDLTKFYSPDKVNTLLEQLKI